MIRWTGLAPWECEFPFPGSLTSTFLVQVVLKPLAVPNMQFQRNSLTHSLTLTLTH